MSIWRTWCACVCTLDGAPIVGGWTWVSMSTLQMSPFPPRRLHEPLLSKSSIQEISFRWLHLQYIYNLQYGRILFTIRPPHIFASIPAPAHALSGGQTARLRRNRERLNSRFCEMTSCRKTGERRSCGNFRRRSAVQR